MSFVVPLRRKERCRLETSGGNEEIVVGLVKALKNAGKVSETQRDAFQIPKVKTNCRTRALFSERKTGSVFWFSVYECTVISELNAAEQRCCFKKPIVFENARTPQR